MLFLLQPKEGGTNSKNTGTRMEWGSSMDTRLWFRSKARAPQPASPDLWSPPGSGRSAFRPPSGGPKKMERRRGGNGGGAGGSMLEGLASEDGFHYPCTVGGGALWGGGVPRNRGTLSTHDNNNLCTTFGSPLTRPQSQVCLKIGELPKWWFPVGFPSTLKQPLRKGVLKSSLGQAQNRLPARLKVFLQLHGLLLPHLLHVLGSIPKSDPALRAQRRFAIGWRCLNHMPK